MIRYAPGEQICRRCIGDSVEARDLARYLDDYVNSLPDDLRASPGEYERRLRICEDCDRRAGLNCTLCGCYVQARAAKRDLDCPNDRGGPKWRAETNQL